MGTTAAYRIDFLTPTGERSSTTIEARSEHEAVKVSRIAKGRIVRIKKDALGGVMHALRGGRASLDVQATVLNLFSPIIGAGRPVGQTFDRIVSEYDIFKPHLDAVRRASKTSDKLKVLDFDSNLILLAEVGEKTNMLAEVLSGAADDMIERAGVVSKFLRGIAPAIAVFVIGLLTLISVPVFLVEQLLEFMATPGMKVTPNVLTHLLIAIGTWAPKLWWLGIAALIGAWLTTERWWPLARRWPIFKLIDNFKKETAAYSFISAFLPLYSRGIPISEAVDMAKQHSRGDARDAYEELGRHIGRGGSFGSGFQHEYWHFSLQIAMRSFDEVKETDKPNLLRKLKPVFLNMVAKSGLVLTVAFGSLGMAAGIMVILIMAAGFMWPLMTAGAAF